MSTAAASKATSALRPPRVALGRETLGELAIARGREWLVTNGIGGFACGTVAGLATRRYHGLLVAALRPPVGRTVTLVKLDPRVRYASHNYDLATNEYADGTVHPHGYRHLESFALDGTVPTWTWAFADALLECRVYMAPGANTTYVSYRLARASAELTVELTPLTAWRDYHSHQHAGVPPTVRTLADGCEIDGRGGSLRLSASGARFEHDGAWHWRFHHAEEAARGLDSLEDLYRPGRFIATLVAGATVTLTATTETDEQPSAAAALQSLRDHEAGLLARVPGDWPQWLRGLALAADQFIVRRGARRNGSGSTIIAGYPWFTDWGRDTMIALPGLTLATGRPEIAREILLTFAQHVDRGVLPNRFPDGAEPPEYNTVDATLWYFQALAAYLAHTGDRELAETLHPTLVDIVEWHDRGTHYGIRADVDGLLRAGESGVQLTWMDAKVGDHVITPRTGKPVEINALWHGALCVLADVTRLVGRKAEAAPWRERADRVARSFVERFWYDEGGYLYDVIDAPDGVTPDATLRPNQLIACALAHPLLDTERTRRIVDVCARELVISFGLRTLARESQSYAPHYRGGAYERDSAYHQGTAWAWLLGPFVRAHLRAYGDPALARSFLEPLAAHVADACAGQISEVFDAEPPHTPGGCFAQAWSVSEVLAGWAAIDAYAQSVMPRKEKQTRR
ncbi:MAG TPA: amylo-alpha-1,6-glucosidase [Candidatus Binataceae bacterium]|nr:amylo-alpha-1,6-glucosidase [Candidatus Binataceae bacterium]